MGTFSIEIHIRAVGSGNPLAPVKCLVDTGAAFCQFPASFLTSLGVTQDRVVPVITSLASLGAPTLEGLGLAADPVRKLLEPTRFPLA